MLGSGGFPLGLVETAAYEDGEALLTPGDTLLIFSDGVSEARNAAGTELGVDRLVDLVRAGRGLDAPTLARAIEQTLDSFSGSAPIDDDRTLLVLKRSPRADV
jgi:sigma-B regulation protein RsbU (phosphoserine phosphatase)